MGMVVKYEDMIRNSSASDWLPQNKRVFYNKKILL